MNSDNKRRLRLLKLWEILHAESDEDNPIGTEEIRRKLALCGIDCDRRTLYSDIESLQEAGYEIFCHRGRSNLYYVMDRKFSVPEVLIVMDAVQAASFITEKKTADLVNKVSSLAGSRKGEVLQKNVVQFSSVKSKNENIYYSVSEISQAILAKKKIKFFYFDYDVAFSRAYKEEDGAKREYVVNPLATVFSSDNYYLICYDDRHKDITQYRVDRMDKVTMLSEPVTPNAHLKNFDVSVYKKELFGMFSGEEVEVKFEAENTSKVINYIYDKFGSAVRLFVLDKDKITFSAKVQLSPNFISWCCSFGDKIKVVSPTSVIKKIKEHIESLSKLYE